ncbi:hypothetical protein LOK49_LG02G01973 [Camellia lanceoleosa]|uniref:Uncharacterized protein n=1 Tax=Camellia lanceoleosa TaxID=1840588 RepID=A0ACC0IKS6_9ERIC|nr:hypothetical protein LOK49_LG02G01973 [Camellia lanceoleosa]
MDMQKRNAIPTRTKTELLLVQITIKMLHSWFSSFRDYEYNRSIRRQKDHPNMIISWLLRTNQIRWFYFSIFLTCSYGTKVEKIEKISHSQPLMKDISIS